MITKCIPERGHPRRPPITLPTLEQGKVKGGLQAKVSLLLKSHIPNEFPLIFSRRLRILALDQASSPLLDRPIRGTFLLELKRSLNSLPNSTSMCLLCTWNNGWFTSSRMHDSKVLPCIFGCDADDSLCHYLKCEPLWTLVYSCFKCNIRYLSQPIHERACVNNLHSCNNARLYTAYSAYHSLRKLHSDLLHNAISSGNFEFVYDELLTLIHLFKADTNRGPFD